MKNVGGVGYLSVVLVPAFFGLAKEDREWAIK